MAVVIRPKYINLTELSKNCVHVVFQTLEEEVTENQVLKGTAGYQ